MGRGEEARRGGVGENTRQEWKRTGDGIADERAREKNDEVERRGVGEGKWTRGEGRRGRRTGEWIVVEC